MSLTASLSNSGWMSADAWLILNAEGIQKEPFYWEIANFQSLFLDNAWLPQM